MSLAEILGRYAASHSLEYASDVPLEWREAASPGGSPLPAARVIIVTQGDQYALPERIDPDILVLVVRSALSEVPLRVLARSLAQRSLRIVELGAVVDPEPLVVLVGRKEQPPHIELEDRLGIPSLPDARQELLHRLNREAVLEAELTSRTSELTGKLQTRIDALAAQVDASARIVEEGSRAIETLAAYRRSRTYRYTRGVSSLIRRFVPRSDR